MIFNEIYSAYYNAVARIIESIIKGNADEKSINKIVSENAFGESVLTLLPSLKSEKWQLVKSDMTTPIKHIPTMPLTLIQKQWLNIFCLLATRRAIRLPYSVKAVLIGWLCTLA